MASNRQRFFSEAYSAARAAGLSDPQARLAASQAALETNFGKSAVRNNYFGIKAGPAWDGDAFTARTWEDEGGRAVRQNARFRAYDHPAESFRDWASTVARRWGDALTAPTFSEAVSGLRYGQPGGYATDRKYGAKLHSINDRYGRDAEIDGLLAEGRIPTPTFADRPGTGINQSDSATGIMAAINPATPMSVTRGVLSEPGMGVSAVAERGLSPSGEASGLLSYRAPEDMASMQAKANLGRQRLEAANGSLNLTSAQTADAMKRRDAALGILHASNPVDAINAVSPLSSPAVTPSTLANAYSQMAGSMGQAGVLGLSGQKVLDLDNDPLGVRGKLAPAPGALAVESMPTVDTTVAGPATSVAINTPQTMGRVSQPVGLLSNDEYGMVRDQQQRLSEMGTNRAIQTKQALKKGLSAFGGGVLGGLIAGPIGSVVGGLLGPAIVNGGILTGRGTNYFPATPSGPVKGDGKQTDYGRSVQKSSGQYDRAVKSGSAGLY